MLSFWFLIEWYMSIEWRRCLIVLYFGIFYYSFFDLVCLDREWWFLGDVR